MNLIYHGTLLDGFDHPYNSTAMNERAVELAVAADWLQHVNGEGLEVGNVLSHYGLGRPRRIVDRYEQGPGVENIDVFEISGRYDWIVSISTIEHVGWDIAPREPSFAQQAISRLASLLAPGGQMLVTVPGGYHPPLDVHLKSGAGATRTCTMVRDAQSWRQTKRPAFKPYAASTPWAESIWIGEWTNG